MEKSADLVHARWTVGCTIPWWTEDRATAGNSPEHTLLADSSHGGSPAVEGKGRGRCTDPHHGLPRATGRLVQAGEEGASMAVGLL
jgi:hypothetical protein